MEAVRRLVGVDPDQPGLGAVDRADELVEVDGAAARGMSPGAARTSASRTAGCGRRGSPTSCSATRSRRARVRRRAASGGVSRRSRARTARGRLVERRPDRLEVVGPVPRREAHVAVREGRAERVRGRVDPPGPALEAERRDDPLARTRAARRAGTRRGGTRRRPRAPPRRSRSGPAAAPRTPRGPRSSASRARSRPAAACTGCPTTRSTRRSGASARRSSGGRGGTTRSRRCARASTHAWWPWAAFERHLGAQLGGDAAGLLPVASGDADEARDRPSRTEATRRAARPRRGTCRPRRR